jgi:hypothetical protein
VISALLAVGLMVVSYLDWRELRAFAETTD